MAVYTFGEFRLDTERMEVAGADGVRETEPQVFDVLRYLVEQHGRLVTKEELLDNVWGDRFVSESALTTRIKQARRLIDDDGRSQSRIRTIRGRGFRFLTPVAERAANEPTTSASADVLPRELAGERTKPFVGRAAEVRRALAVLERPSRTATWIQILGEPGIGKTRLAARIAQLATERGIAVLFGRCSEDLAVPYQPVIEAIRSAGFAPHGDELLAAMGPSAFDLTRLVPELADELPDDRRPGPADPETERHRLFEAIGSWFEAVAAERPLAVVIDDAHWATDSTMRLLTYAARSSLDGAVTFVITARDTAPDVRPELRELISAIDARSDSVTLRMSGLAEDEVRELVDPDVDVAAVVRQTAGNPLLVNAVSGNSDHGVAADIDTAVHQRLARLAQP
ncbi:MAG: AAA family ATPase, partial [Ilumatobacter sp.]|nr:AAA family ATPase [Ilumatobacter sp.]